MKYYKFSTSDMVVGFDGDQDEEYYEIGNNLDYYANNFPDKISRLYFIDYNKKRKPLDFISPMSGVIVSPKLRKIIEEELKMPKHYFFPITIKGHHSREVVSADHFLLSINDFDCYDKIDYDKTKLEFLYGKKKPKIPIKSFEDYLSVTKDTGDHIYADTLFFKKDFVIPYDIFPMREIKSSEACRFFVSEQFKECMEKHSIGNFDLRYPSNIYLYGDEPEIEITTGYFYKSKGKKETIVNKMYYPKK